MFSTYPFLFWWLWGYFCFTLLLSSNWKYKSLAIVKGLVMKQYHALYVLCSYGIYLLKFALKGDMNMLILYNPAVVETRIFIENYVSVMDADAFVIQGARLSPAMVLTVWNKSPMRKDIPIPWICYERSFNEFCLFIWNPLVLNQRLQLFVQSTQPYLLIFAWKK